MATPLNILIVEDSTSDTDLLLAKLRDDGFAPKWARVEAELDYRASLGPHLDLIFVDFSLPQFSVPRAIELLKESGLDIPFVIVSGTIGEERAVECLRGGATDYVLKDRLNRLGPVVRRALGEARERAERQRAERELRWRTAFFDAQVQSAPDGILVVNNQGKKILQNQQLIELFKVPELIAKSANHSELLQHVIRLVKNPRQFSERVAYLYAHPDEIGHDEIELADGTILDRYSAPVRDKAGEDYGRIWTFRDITERRHLEAQLRQAQKMEAIGQLAGGVAHDFNNNLSVIQSYVEILQLNDPLPDEMKEALEQIGLATKNAANLTCQLLAFSRKQVIQLRHLDLNEVVSKLAKMLKRVLGDDILLEVNCGSDVLTVQADGGMIEQVLMNLAVNARDAMPQGGKLKICTLKVSIGEEYRELHSDARPGDYTCLTITDTGNGIPPAVLPHIFEPFFTTKEIGKGTGLGLATVYGIVRQHRGWIQVASEVNSGTAFRIYLPLAMGVLDKESETADGGVVPTGTETILVVEDEPALRALTKKLLTRAGYTVVEASSGVTALETWSQHESDIDLVLTDMVMPNGMSGPDLIERLRQKKSSLRAIYISGYVAETVAKNLVLIEGDNFLSKPCSFHKLALTVRKALDKE